MTPQEFKRLRLRLGYASRGELAEAMGISRYAIEHWEYGRRPVPKYAETLIKCLLREQERDELKN
jgi:DNA-binding transcriptional regulator YiaG